jgi:hypothetical protein
MGQVAAIWTAQQEHVPKVLRRHRMELLLRDGVPETLLQPQAAHRGVGPRGMSPSSGTGEPQFQVGDD